MTRFDVVLRHDDHAPGPERRSRRPRRAGGQDAISGDEVGEGQRSRIGQRLCSRSRPQQDGFLPDVDDETKLTWALPYWNYSDASNPRAGELPPAFAAPRMPDGSPNPLKVAQRYGLTTTVVSNSFIAIPPSKLIEPGAAEMVYVALDTLLASIPLAVAMALIVVVAATEIGPGGPTVEWAGMPVPSQPREVTGKER
jgi:hypothetical protein